MLIEEILMINIDEKYLKKCFNGKINTNFCNNEIPKEGSQCTFLSAIFIDSVYRKDKNYYSQALSK